MKPRKHHPGTVKRQCRYRHCTNNALRGWTTCSSHKTAGISMAQFKRTKGK